MVRPVDQQGRYGGFARLDADSGRVLGQISAEQVPESGWWLAFPPRMEKLGFLRHDKPGNAFDLAGGRNADVKDERGWSFCVTDPKPLALKGQNPGFYSVASLCEYGLADGKRVSGSGRSARSGSPAARTAGGCGVTRGAASTGSRTATAPRRYVRLTAAATCTAAPYGHSAPMLRRRYGRSVLGSAPSRDGALCTPYKVLFQRPRRVA